MGLAIQNFTVDQEQLSLQKSKHGVLKCWGRLQADYPIYLLDSVSFTAGITKPRNSETPKHRNTETVI